MQSLDFKKYCQKLRTGGYTLGEIVRLTHRPKTSVYFHIRNIPPTSECREKIRKMSMERIRGRGPKKGKSISGHSYIKFHRWTPSLVNLFGHAIFDGSIIHTGIIYYNRSPALLNNFSKKMNAVYKPGPKIYKSLGGVTRLAYYNVELYSFFRQKTSELLSHILRARKNLQREFLRSFFDDEGSVYFIKSRNQRKVRGYQYNLKILLIVQELLKNFGISSIVDTNFHEITITKRENIKKFAKEINFSKGLRVNGNRSNSIWKRSLEKRKILSNLLASYQ